MAINLSRNTRLWVSTVNTGHNNANTFEIPIQEGYSLSQAVSSSDVTVNEAGPAPTRGSKRFNDTMEPVEWSFSTYITPYTQGGKTYLVDMLLWQGLAVAKAVAPDFENVSTTSKVKAQATKFSVDFSDNSAHVLTELYLYFLIDNQMYLVSKAQVSQAEISVNIDEIGMVTWTGQAIDYLPIATPAFVSGGGLPFDAAAPTADKYVQIPANKKYIVNKLTIMDLNSDAAPSANDNYNIPITSGSFTINNNITYLTPSTLAEVDKPIGSFTGTFDVTGTIEAYLRDTGGDGTVGTPYGSAELLAHMLANVGTAVNNAANLVMHIGGKAVGDPSCVLTIPNGHLSVPDFSVDDVVSTSIEIKGIPSSTDLSSGTEVYVDFFAANV